MGQVAETEAKQVIETDDAGRLIIPAEVLGDVGQHTRYTVELIGANLLVEPQSEDTNVTQRLDEVSATEWLRHWRELSEEIGKVWPEGVSAVNVVSEMRR